MYNFESNVIKRKIVYKKLNSYLFSMCNADLENRNRDNSNVRL